MQKNYVFAEKDVLPFSYIVSQWKRLEGILKKMD